VSRALGEVFAQAVRRLTAAGADAPRTDARLLIAKVLAIASHQVVTEGARALTDDEFARIEDFLKRREGREPLARILGGQEFWSLSFAVTADTLIPRPDSETLVEAALAYLKPLKRPLRVLDLGTGTGCLLLSVLHELPEATGIGVDINPGAVSAATANAAALGLADRATFMVGDWAMHMEGRFDAVLANPPYIADDAIAALEPEVARFEPRLALAGGPDGLQAYRCIAAELPRLMAHGSHAFIEIGEHMLDSVTALFAGNAFQVTESKADLAGIPRCIVVRRK
jgi:release factor glutamine methyltransferase